MSRVEDEIRGATEKRQNGNAEDCLKDLESLMKTSETNSELLYEIASTYDSMGKEEEAIPFYERSLEIGLGDNQQAGALVGLGSSFRCVGKLEESLRIFNRAIENFRERNEFRVFRSLTLHDMKRDSEAIMDLMQTLIATTKDEEILRYKKALSKYAEKLKK